MKAKFLMIGFAALSLVIGCGKKEDPNPGGSNPGGNNPPPPPPPPPPAEYKACFEPKNGKYLIDSGEIVEFINCSTPDSAKATSLWYFNNSTQPKVGAIPPPQPYNFKERKKYPVKLQVFRQNPYKMDDTIQHITVGWKQITQIELKQYPVVKDPDNSLADIVITYGPGKQPARYNTRPAVQDATGELSFTPANPIILRDSVNSAWTFRIWNDDATAPKSMFTLSPNFITRATANPIKLQQGDYEIWIHYVIVAP